MICIIYIPHTKQLKYLKKQLLLTHIYNNEDDKAKENSFKKQNQKNMLAQK